MDKQRYREHLLEGVIGIKDFLERVKKISDPEGKREQAKKEYTK